MRYRALAGFAMSATIALGAAAAAQAAAFSVSSPAFADGGVLPAAGARPACGGGSEVTPPLVLSNVPASAKSLAILLFDPDTKSGGFAHWVAYGIPAETHAIPAGFGSPPAAPEGVNGTGGKGLTGYCPPAGDAPHHYVFTVYATDLAPGALAPGLNRDQLLSALKGHIVGAQSIVGRYAQP